MVRVAEALGAAQHGRTTPVTVIVNRAARSAAGVPWSRVVDELRAHDLAPVLLRPATRAEAVAAARMAARRGVGVVVAAGGDGTVNTVVNAVAGFGVAVAILPLGTANDLAREVGLPLDAAGAARVLGACRARRVDLVDVGGRAFATVGGVGLPAACALAVDRLRARSRIARRLLGRLGTGVYPLVAAATILGAAAAPRRLRIAYRDPAGATRTIDTVAHGVFVANQRALAAGLALPTGSVNDDGVFELCVVRDVSRARLLQALGCLRLGRPVPPGVFAVYRATRARIHSEVEDTFFGDGDALARGRRFDLHVRPRALRVLC